MILTVVSTEIDWYSITLHYIIYYYCCINIIIYVVNNFTYSLGPKLYLFINIISNLIVNNILFTLQYNTYRQQESRG